MPNTIEKLMSLIWHKQDCGLTHNANGQDLVTYNEELADHLIANGVTIQQWIPVTERLPDGMEWVLCACKDGEVHILCYDYIMDDWDIHHKPNSCYGKGFVTHWMPLPEPPKEA